MRYTTRIIVPPKIRRSGLPGGKESRHAPHVIGVKKSFGFGDCLGLAAPGHLRAAAAYKDWAPFFAQQSVEEITRTNRTPDEVLRTALRAVELEGFRQPWGADADRLKTPSDVETAATAGFTLFTIDPSEYIEHAAETLPIDELEGRIGSMVEGGELPENWFEPYLGRSIDLPGDWSLKLTQAPLQRAAVKFGRAVEHCRRMYEAAMRANRGRPVEIEVCMDGTMSPATPLEHLFVGLELEARGVRVTNLALRLAGDFEPGIDYHGDLEAFENRLREHVAIAQFCGPYKLAIHGGSDKFNLYPLIGRLCGELVHIKTSGTTFLEGLRAICRVDVALFLEIARFCQDRFAECRGSSGCSTTVEEVRALGDAESLESENVFLDERSGRQMFLATYGPLLTEGRATNGRLFKAAMVETLTGVADLHHEIIAAHFEKHLRMLNAG